MNIRKEKVLYHNMKGKIMKKLGFIKYICVFLIVITVFLTLLTLTSLFPSEAIHDNVKESAEVLLKEGNRKRIYIPYRGEILQFDNYSDALMINIAYSIDEKTPLYSAFTARKNYIPNVTTEVYEDTAGDIKSSSKYEYHNEVGELNDLANGEKAESFEYARHWNGYIVFLRPLLLLFNITQLRVILTILLIILSIILAFLLYKKINIIVSIIFLTSLLSVEYFYLGYSLLCIFVFLIAIITSIILINKFDKMKNFGLMFFVSGMLANFVDLLTVPMVTLAIPLIIYLLLIQRKEKNIGLKKQIITIIKFSFLWGIGYALSWFSKWLLIDLIYNKNIIQTALNQVLFRSQGLQKYFNLISVILANLQYIYSTFYISIIITITIISLVTILKSYKNNYSPNKDIKVKYILARILPYMLIACFPFAWYTVLQNHSYFHAFFTYRHLIITIICINLCIEQSFEMYLSEEKGIEDNEK